MKRILVSRFSALGDVAIAVHVLSAVLSQNQDIEILLLTKKPFQQLFEDIDRVKIIEVDFNKRHKGIFGIKRLVVEISRTHKIDLFADIHNVIRTKLIRFFLSYKIKKAAINKGRAEKHYLTKRKNKKLHQLKHTAERYADVFRKLGINVDLSQNYSLPILTASKNIEPILSLQGTKIGIAPFAKHKSKTYPIDKMENIVANLSKNNTILIFGGGQKEKDIAKKWATNYSNVHSIIGKFSMKEEIALLNNCSTVITMDSGNMHLASLTKTKIISFWGATHPFLGFTPFKKQESVYIQKELSCRPCSVFGSKKCYKGTWECLYVDENSFIKNINKI